MIARLLRIGNISLGWLGSLGTEIQTDTWRAEHTDRQTEEGETHRHKETDGGRHTYRERERQTGLVKETGQTDRSDRQV
jgi:hypothetical protein